MGAWVAVSGFVTGRRTKWLVLVVTLLAGGAFLSLAGAAAVSDDPASGLSSSAESSRAARAQEQLPSGQISPALLVYSRDGVALAAADLSAIGAQAAELRDWAVGGAVPPPQVSKDRQAATEIVPLAASSDARKTVEAVKQIREQVGRGLPEGLRVQVTGGAGFTADLAGVFEGTDTTLLLTTVVVVAVLLLITYRSPWLWLLPLAVVGFADRITAGIIAIMSRHTDLPVSNATIGIVSVLVFGAGTDYALLLIARYREELRAVPDRHEAMRRALIAAGPAILASGVTVAASLASLFLAALPSTVSIGVTSAIGVAVALAFGLLVLPSTLLVFGRWLFWPLVPQVGQRDRQRDGAWARIGRSVAVQPRIVVAACLVLLAVLASGLAGTRYGLSQTEQFRTKAESIDGLKTLAAHFPAGASDPVAVVTNVGQAEQVRAAAAGSPGVASATVGERTDRLARVDVVLTASPDTPASYTALRDLRERVHTVDGADALVGGSVATNLDTRDAAARDQRVIIPIVLAVVLLILVVLVRALVAPILMVITVVISFAAALGASRYAFTHWLDYPALDVSVPLLAFLFLVALGVDYNIFLVSRGREEAVREGTRRGIITALAVTGGVITSAGILLASVFAVLGVLPLIVLTELGIIVGFGVLLDTLLVRTVLMPALVTILGKRFWWPSALSSRDGADTPADTRSPTVAL